jgi:hypothetical protein
VLAALRWRNSSQAPKIKVRLRPLYSLGIRIGPPAEIPKLAPEIVVFRIRITHRSGRYETPD